jgi:hypothetical protein
MLSQKSGSQWQANLQSTLLGGESSDNFETFWEISVGDQSKIVVKMKS